MTSEKSIISKLRRGIMSHREIPEEYKNCLEIVFAERKLGIRTIEKRGYDIILDKFFVEEKVDNQKNRQLFDSFDDYSTYVEGDIYENACYYQMNVSKINQKVDLKRLFVQRAFLGETIDDYSAPVTEKDRGLYIQREERKRNIKKWNEKFERCSNAEEYIKVAKKYRKTQLYNDLSLDYFGIMGDHTRYFLWKYIGQNETDKDRFETVMSYLSGFTCAKSIVRQICLVYDPKDVARAYNCKASSSKSGNEAQNTRLRNFARAVEANQIRFEKTIAYFDIYTHDYCEEKIYRILDGKYTNNQNMGLRFSTYKYFDNFEDFVKYRQGDLSDTNLSGDIKLKLDLSSVKINENTKLPIANLQNPRYNLVKGFENDCFFVVQRWYNQGKVYGERRFKFDYFCDFVSFLKGDLSDADLASCDNLINLQSADGICFKNAMIQSAVCAKLGLEQSTDKRMFPAVTFSYAEENEKQTAVVYQSSREIEEETKAHDVFGDEDYNTQKVFYISDIHFDHLLHNHNARTEADVINIVRKVAENITKESAYRSFVLINGDTSADFSVFKLFVEELDRISKNEKKFIFTLGNHDLWGYPTFTFDEITDAYRSLLEKHGMYLLQNCVLLVESPDCIRCISEDKLNEFDSADLRNQARKAQFVFFGGTGFSGYNEYNNASSGLYRMNETIGFDRQFEIEQTKKFESLYNKVCQAFDGKNVIVMTHTPLSDWYGQASVHRLHSKEEHQKHRFPVLEDYKSGFIYLWGHDHKNVFYDDGIVRVYSDNQFGYNTNNIQVIPHLKSFEIDIVFDCFLDYDDGIYEITAEDYRNFYRGKNKLLNYNRDSNVIMLKKNGFYCFIQRLSKGDLSILNGGSVSRLDHQDVQYYYDNMDRVVSRIKAPLDKYTSFQKKISDVIKKCGGSGYIHGCIIDIDDLNHIFVNPFDRSLTGYFAIDMVDKLIYPTIPALLKAHCPSVFAAYQNMIEASADKKHPLPVERKTNKSSIEPIYYLDTHMYSASKQIKKMQRLDSRILIVWVETPIKNKALPPRQTSKQIPR